jgi:hypothetical protein
MWTESRGRAGRFTGLVVRLFFDVARGLRRSGYPHRVHQALLRFAGRIRDLGHFVPISRMRPSDPTDGLVVSVTSFPDRISRVALTLESIHRQTVTPERVVLVLASSQFANRRLPLSLRVQLARPNVELLWVSEDTRSYKKLVPVRLRYPEATIVTIDDDVIYHRHFLAELVAASERNPASIIGHRGWELRVADGTLSPYAAARPAHPNSPHERVLLTGVGGILYPPRSLPVGLLADPVAQQLCPTADDVWFWALARVAGTRTLCLGSHSSVYRAITSLMFGASLQAVNNELGGNDRQIAAAVRHFDLEPVIGATPAGPFVD